MNRMLYLLLTVAFFTACKNERSTHDQARIVFEPGDLQFIASSLNPKLETMSVLYGNDSALQSLAKGNHPAAGTVMKLVTWRYHDNPQYFGSKINGELLSVETVQAGSHDSIAYRLDFGTLQRPATQAERITYIMRYKPVQIP
ncbi:cytochrome P460 family protein [Chitinophaga sp. G-6-1-13]|uniref:Cytochrome P460 family protein n=1 Tax=Chitinophaga fulva TaxID=2728842 RepID=A0A848GJW8_9BACT|nr:hypothetical protein [Chitinophaga fulva]NML38704.1 cytochrome P460 family protein [Chitinophaga fulva]